MNNNDESEVAYIVTGCIVGAILLILVVSIIMILS